MLSWRVLDTSTYSPTCSRGTGLQMRPFAAFSRAEIVRPHYYAQNFRVEMEKYGREVY